MGRLFRDLPQFMPAPRVPATSGPSYDSLIEGIGPKEFQELTQRRMLRQLPVLAVIDTNFVHSGLRSHLRHGGAPKTLEAAGNDSLRLFVASETLDETLRKLPEFAHQFGTSVGQLEAVLAEEWLPVMRVVEVPPGTSTDSRALAVAGRDPGDYAAAQLATLLAPCILLTQDLDFEALDILRPGNPVAAVDAAVGIEQASISAIAPLAVPAVPVAGTVAGVRYVAVKINVNPWLLGAALTAVAVICYRRMTPERRANWRRNLGEVATEMLKECSNSMEEFHMHERELYERTVPASSPRSPENIVMCGLARADEPLSAQRLWEQLDPVGRPSVPVIRRILRSNPAFCSARHGVFTLGETLAAGDA